MAESRLPRHCNPELVEHALASLEKSSVTNSVLLSPENENYKLLEALGEYTKNDRFDLIGYKIAVGAMFAMIPAMVICSVFIAVVFALPFSQLGLIVYASSLFTLFVSCIFGIAMVSSEGTLGIKLGRWIGDIVNGKNREPGNLQDLDEKLNQFINGQAKVSQEESDHLTTYPKIYPSFPINNPDLTVQDTTNANDSSQQITKNRLGMK